MSGRLLWTIGDGLQLGVSVYSMVMDQKKKAGLHLHAPTNQLIKSQRSYVYDISCLCARLLARTCSLLTSLSMSTCVPIGTCMHMAVRVLCL